LKNQKDKYFWSIVEIFNLLMRKAIRGPDCTDPDKCRGDCCSIKIDIPKILAKEYIKRGYASKKDFTRSDNFTFQFRFDNGTGKCFLFDKEINGCRVHFSKIKPPQCFIYPTGFSCLQDRDIKCKKLTGWEILDAEKALKAEELLQKYVFLCKLEAKKELRRINKRLGFDKSKKSNKNLVILKKLLNSVPPSSLGGFKDSWENFEVLYAEGLSLQMKKFCIFHKKSCKFLPDDFFECKSLCNKIIDELLEFLKKHLYNFIKLNGPDTSGEYPLYKLFEYAKLF
jgi:hypothetical protein